MDVAYVRSKPQFVGGEQVRDIDVMLSYLSLPSAGRLIVAVDRVVPLGKLDEARPGTIVFEKKC